MWMNSISIGPRMALAMAAMLLAMVMVGVTGGVGLSKLQATANTLVDVQLATKDEVGILREALAQSRRYEKDVLLAIGDPVSAKKAKEQWDAEQGRVDGVLKQLGARGNDLATSSAELGARLKNYRTRFIALHQQIEMGALDNAMAANRLVRGIEEEFASAQKSTDAMTQVVTQAGRSAVEGMAQDYRRTLAGAAVVVAVAALVAVFLGWQLQRSVVLPVKAGVRVAESIAHGDLSTRVTVIGNDEIAHLMRTVERMQEALRGMVAEVSRTASSIQSASSEIASGNVDLSTRTERQASSLQQTAASVSTLVETVHQSAAAAQQARELASTSSAAADNSGTVVRQVVQTMADITASSTRVAEIVGLIDGIAFQTNILALNAAVEAARAGEQGRGFAVVAAEVRTLAQRSGNAAKEIRTLIQQSGDRVKAGSALVTRAGSAIDEVVSSVTRMATLVNEISNAATEQSRQLGELNGAVTQIDQMTQQNAALVEQTTAASDSLKSQAIHLNDAVSVFRLDSASA